VNIGDLVRIIPEWGVSKNNLGIIVHEYHRLFPTTENMNFCSPPNQPLPELYYHVYNFHERQVMVYNSFEMKIINKAPHQTSYTTEGY